MDPTLVPAINVTDASLPGNSTKIIPPWTLALGGTSACLSIFGAIGIFISYATIPDIRNFTRKLLTYLTVADILSALGYLVGHIRYAAVERDSYHHPVTDQLCKAQSFTIIFSSLASYLWTIVIAFHIFISYVCQSNVTSNRGARLSYHVICWGVPAVVAITAASCGVLGEDYSLRPMPWCFLKGTLGYKREVAWTFGITISWELMTYLATSSLYIYLKFYMFLKSRRFRIEVLNTNLRPEDKNYVYVWLIMYILKVWGTVRLFTLIVHRETSVKYEHIMFILLNIQCTFTSAQGFANFLLFCVFDKVVRIRFVRCFYRNTEEGRPLLHLDVIP